MTSHPSIDARATNSRQLFVPRSMAAKVCAKRPLCQPPLDVDSPPILNSFFEPMVHHARRRGKSACQSALPSLNSAAGQLSRFFVDSLTVEQTALTRLVIVRIQVPKPAGAVSFPDNF